MKQLKIEQFITNRENQSLDKYLREIGKIKILTAEEETELAKQAREGNQKAQNDLVKANLRFVVSVAKQYQNQGLSLSDLINEGNLGLIEATQRFDETRGFKFISYAVRRIRQSILQALAEQSRIVRLPMNRNTEIMNALKANNTLFQELQREPSAEELASHLGLPIEEVQKTLSLVKSNSYGGDHISLDMPLEEGENDRSFLDILDSGEESPDHNVAYTESLQIDIKDAVSYLSDIEAEIVKRSFGLNGNLPQSAEVIGEIVGKTRERVYQIQEKAKKKIHKFLSRRMISTSTEKLPVKDRKYIEPHITKYISKETIKSITTKRQGIDGGITVHDIYEPISLGHSKDEVNKALTSLFEKVLKKNKEIAGDLKIVKSLLEKSKDRDELEGLINKKEYTDIVYATMDRLANILDQRKKKTLEKEEARKRKKEEKEEARKRKKEEKTLEKEEARKRKKEEKTLEKEEARKRKKEEKEEKTPEDLIEEKKKQILANMAKEKSIQISHFYSGKKTKKIYMIAVIKDIISCNDENKEIEEYCKDKHNKFEQFFSFLSSCDRLADCANALRANDILKEEISETRGLIKDLINIYCRIKEKET